MTGIKRYTPLQIAVHIGAWFPLLRLIVEAITDNLTANPIQHIEQRTGRAAITLLFLSLAATPLNSLFGWREPIQRRRALGLYAFMYAVVHVVIFADLDYGLAWSLIYQTIIEKPYLIVGALAFILLVPLAASSFDVWKMSLKKNWKRIHSLVYFIAPLTVLHFAWGKKGDFFHFSGEVARPWAYAIVLAILMTLRIPAVRRFIASMRTRVRLPFLKPTATLR